ncbi:vascular cell adhesion protein 1 [Tiliqua scincoides]|uniref:vascular cell adhesion protein 1 n=1 Tax=Tiliqua scincoides TaxID=71010 RepID=UPI003461C220
MTSGISAVPALLLMAMTSLAFDMMEIVPGHKVAAQIGKELVLSCRTSGCPVAPTFLWRAQLDYPLGGTVHQEGSNSFLTMKRITFESAHEYLCTATCGEDKKQKRVKVDVYSFPEDPVIEISSLLVLGRQAEVTCSVPTVYPSDRLEVSLKIGEKLIGERDFFEDPDTESLQTKSLRVLFTPTEGDIGKDITCIAKLPIDDMKFEPKERQTTHKLNVADEPRNTAITVIPSTTVKEGEDVTLICSTHGSPTPAVFWKKRQANGTSQLILEGATLTIKNIQPEDTGFYECEAVNLAGKENKAIELVVQVFSSTALPSTTSPSTTPPSTISPSTTPPSTISPSTTPPSTISSSTIAPSTISSSTTALPVISSSTIPPSTISTSGYQPEHSTEMEDFTIHSTPYSAPLQKTDDKEIQQENEVSTAAKDTNFMLYRTSKNDKITYSVSVADDITNGTEEVIVIARREELDSITTAVIVAASLATVAGPVAAILLYISRKAKINGSYSLVNSPEQKV